MQVLSRKVQDLLAGISLGRWLVLKTSRIAGRCSLIPVVGCRKVDRAASVSYVAIARIGRLESGGYVEIGRTWRALMRPA